MPSLTKWFIKDQCLVIVTTDVWVTSVIMYIHYNNDVDMQTGLLRIKIPDLITHLHGSLTRCANVVPCNEKVHLICNEKL